MPRGWGGIIGDGNFSKALTLNGYDPPSSEHYHNFIRGLNGGQAKIADVPEAAMFLAQVIHESNGFQNMEEINADKAHYANPDSGGYNGCDPKWKKLAGSTYKGISYYGRGYIQLSWLYNYYRASEALYGSGDKLARNPDLVATDQKTAWDTAFWYWGEEVHGKATTFDQTTKIINSIDTKEQTQKRQRVHANVKKAFGID